MTVLIYRGEEVELERVYEGGKWEKVTFPDGHCEWVRVEEVLEEER